MTRFHVKYGTWFETIRRHRYYLHALGYLVIIYWKNLTDGLNEPINIVQAIGRRSFMEWKGILSCGFRPPSRAMLTAFLNFRYLFVYLFLIYVTTVYFAYASDRDMTDKVTLNYLLIYALAVPYIYSLMSKSRLHGYLAWMLCCIMMDGIRPLCNHMTLLTTPSLHYT